jgi:hypothetical protein
MDLGLSSIHHLTFCFTSNHPHFEDGANPHGNGANQHGNWRRSNDAEFAASSNAIAQIGIANSAAFPTSFVGCISIVSRNILIAVIFFSISTAAYICGLI